jgi:branched-chain amino acid transport system substrate-binding protein
MKQQRQLLTAGAAILATALVLAGCATRGSSSSDSVAQAGTARTTCDTDGNSQGITSSTIKLGMFTPLTGPVADPGNGALDGFKFALDETNAAGGVKGRKIQLVTQDDQYDTTIAQQAARKLETSDKVFAFAGGVGTPNFVAVLPYIKANHIPAVGPYAPSNQVGVMANPDVYMIWPNFIDEFNVSVSWMLKNEPVKSLSFMEQTGDVGDDALTGIKEALKGSGLSLGTIQTTEPTTTDFSAIAQALKKENSEMVVMLAGPVVVGQAIAAMHQIGYYPKLLAQSDLTDESWLSEYGKSGEGMIVATKTAPIAGSTDPLVTKFAEAFKAKTGKAATMWNTAGYTQALVTIEALKKSKALTRDCFELALDTMKGFKTGFIPPVTFSFDSRQGTNAVGVAKIEDSKVVQVAPFQLVKH